MARVVLTPHLRPYTGGVSEAVASGARVCELLEALNAAVPGLRHYVVDDRGVLRPHVNVFVDGEPVRDRDGLTDPVAPNSTVHILQALSGG